MSLLKYITFCLFIFSVVGCSKQMAVQQKLKSENHPNLTLPAHTVSTDLLNDSGEIQKNKPVESLSTLEELNNGKEVYKIYCTLCHSSDGKGDGIVVQRGFPPAASLPDLQLTDSEMFRVIQNGNVFMPAFKDMLSPEKISEVIAYVKVLKLRQNIPAKFLNQSDIDQLNSPEAR